MYKIERVDMFANQKKKRKILIYYGSDACGKYILIKEW